MFTRSGYECQSKLICTMWLLRFQLWLPWWCFSEMQCHLHCGKQKWSNEWFGIFESPMQSHLNIALTQLFYLFFFLLFNTVSLSLTASTECLTNFSILRPLWQDIATALACHVPWLVNTSTKGLDAFFGNSQSLPYQESWPECFYLEQRFFQAARAPPTTFLGSLVVDEAGQHSAGSVSIVVSPFLWEMCCLAKDLMQEDQT